jgi:hypothetical protein
MKLPVGCDRENKFDSQSSDLGLGKEDVCFFGYCVTNFYKCGGLKIAPVCYLTGSVGKESGLGYQGALLRASQDQN